VFLCLVLPTVREFQAPINELHRAHKWNEGKGKRKICSRIDRQSIKLQKVVSVKSSHFRTRAEKLRESFMGLSRLK
jgi:hypothetical protein